MRQIRPVSWANEVAHTHISRCVNELFSATSNVSIEESIEFHDNTEEAIMDFEWCSLKV